MASTTELAATQVCVHVAASAFCLRGGVRRYVIYISSHCSAQQRISDEIIDRRVFQGIVDLNDIDSTDFSTQMVDTYLAVATSTLADMDQAVCVSLDVTLTHPDRSTVCPYFYPTCLLVREVFLLTCYGPTGGTRTFPNYLYWLSRCRTRRTR